MAITFGVYQKKEKKLILIVAIVLVIGGLIAGIVLLRQKPVSLFLEIPKPQAPKINWQTISDPRIETLQPLTEIPPLTEKPG